VSSGDVPAINGLAIPSALTAAMMSGRWPESPDIARLRNVFPDEPVRPRLYSEATMRAINRSWASENDEVYVGQASERNPPGDIDPALSLLIGELGPDQLIALDYRTSSSSPRVLYLTGASRSPWRQVADSINELIERLNHRLS
jgi:hypothetical protein